MSDDDGVPDDAPWWVRMVVSNWRIVWRQMSTWFITITGVVAMVPPDTWQLLGFNEAGQHRAVAICAVLALISKYVKQPALEGK